MSPNVVTRRTTISVDPAIYDSAIAMAEQEKRSFSNLVEVALAELLDARQSSPDAVVSAAVEEAKSAGVDVVGTLSRAVRARKGACA